MKTKVVEYISRMKDGGAETIVRDYALLLDKDKFDVTVVCEDYKKDSANYRILKENGVHCVYTYGSFNYPHRALARIIGPKYKARLLKKALDDMKPDVIHIHLESLEVIQILSNYLKNVKLIFTCQNIPRVCIGDDRPRERDACKYLLEHNHLQILALHQDMANEIEKMFDINNVLVFRSGTNFNRFKNITETKEEIRKAEGIPEDCYLVGHIGRFVPQKNHEFLIKVFNEIVKKNDKAYLLLLGSGQLLNDVQKQIEELGLTNKVKIMCNRTDTPRLFKSMDVFLFPSRYEGISVSMIEAQKAEVPCVVSNNIPDETFCEKNISVLTYDDPLEKWADTCLNPIGNIKKWNDIEEYDINNIVRRLEKLYLK